MYAELAWEVGSLHSYPETIIDLKRLLNEVDALEAAEHVVDWDEAAPVLLELCLNVQVCVLRCLILRYTELRL